MRSLIKNRNQSTYFHLNFEFEICPLMAVLDWKLLCYQLNKISSLHQIELQAFVMMTTHSHLLFKSYAQKENYFTDNLFTNLKVKTKDPNSLTEPIKNKTQYLNTYKYIYRNPVEAGLSMKCEKYPYGSLNALLGYSTNHLNIIDPLNVTQNPFKILNWLNQTNQSKLFQASSVFI